MSSYDEELIFGTAFEIDDEQQRARYLEAACGADAQLRERVQSLLNSAKKCGSFLQKRAADSFEVGSDLVDEDHIGQAIGRYKLLEKIGEGGFGDVYMAEQQEPVLRKVALKIIKPGMGSKQVIARFEAERQALALMEHANIGKFLDAGATNDGRPYFVMELVRGIPIIEYCEQHRLSIEERLELFADICSAVEHAHQKGIIHRDIKPTNILVYNNGQRPVPKVIDFGIAKATHGRLTDKTLFTQFHQFIGTPAYMSPEQAQMSGVDIDTRSDIYSLGVLLYELLTGKTPVDAADLQQQGFEETCRRIRDDDAPKPSKRISTLTHAELTTLANSRRTDPAHAVMQLRGDLDWIVMKALEKDRTRRYKTTDALASDIQRYLNHEPVSAGPPSAAYHLRKFLRRNRMAALTTLAFAAVLLLGTIVSIVGWTRAVGGSKALARQVVKTQQALADSNESRNEARAAMQRAESERIRAVKSAYLADIQAAHQALQLNNLGLARKLLQTTRDLDPDGELRHWEWRALWARCRGNAKSSFGGDHAVDSLSIHPDGAWAAVASRDSVRVWDIFAGTIVREFKCQGNVKASFSKDGKRLYAVDETGLLRAWHVSRFEAADFTLRHDVPFDYDLEMKVSADGTLLATFSGRKAGQITVWDLQARTPKKIIRTEFWRCPMVYSPDGTQLILGGGRILLDLRSMNETYVEDEEAKGTPAYSPDGEYIAIRRETGFVVHRVSDGEIIAEVEGHHHNTTGVAYSLDGKLLATASFDQTVRLWDTSTYQAVAELRNHDLVVNHLEFSPNRQHLLSAGRDGKVCVWDLAEVRQADWPIKRMALHNWNTPTTQVSCSPDGRFLATTHTKDKNKAGVTLRPGITLLSSKDLREVRTLAESCGDVLGLLYSPTQNLLAICSEQGALEFVDVASDTVKRVAMTKGKQTLPVQFTPDGKRLLAVVRMGDSAEMTNTVYCVSDGSLIASWSTLRQECAAISPDGESVVTGHNDGLRFWSLADPQNPTYVKVGGLRHGTPGLLWSVDFSPDGAYVIAGGNLTGRIEIVDARAKRPVGHLTGHSQHIMAVRFSPDGKRIASGGHTFSDALKIWDFESRREIMSLSVDGAWSARQVEWLPDGNSIMLLTGGSIISIWRVPSWEEIQAQERQDARR